MIIVSEPDVPIGFLDYYNHDKSNKTLLPGLQLSQNHSVASQIPSFPVKYFPQLCFHPEATLPSIPFLQRPSRLLPPSAWLREGHQLSFTGLRKVAAPKATRKFVREISVRITGDILKPQYGFRQCYGMVPLKLFYREIVKIVQDTEK